eukprot:5482198-Alexandrium_andersonii.AAC.1
MLSHSDLGRREAAHQVALSERSRHSAALSGGGLERARRGLCRGGLASIRDDSAIAARPAHR